MSTKNENVKVGVGAARKTGTPQNFDQPNRYSHLSQILSILSVILSKQERFKELLEKVTIPASLLLSLTAPILLLSISGGSFVVFLFAIPVILSGIAWGVLMFRRRAKETRIFPSIITRQPPSR